LERNRADRFGRARSTAYVVWTRQQREKIKEIVNDTEEEPSEEETRLDAKFNG